MTRKSCLIFILSLSLSFSSFPSFAAATDPRDKKDTLTRIQNVYVPWGTPAEKGAALPEETTKIGVKQVSKTITPEDIAALEAKAQDQSIPDEVRSETIDAIGTIGENSGKYADRCIDALTAVALDNSNSYEVRSAALNAISRIGQNNARAADACIKALKSIALDQASSEEIAAEALYAIGDIGASNGAVSDKCIDVLKDIALNTGNSASARDSAVSALGNIGVFNKTAANTCLAILSSLALDTANTNEMSASALDGIARIGAYNAAFTNKCIGILKGIATDKTYSDELRSSATDAIGTIGGNNEAASDKCVSILKGIAADKTNSADLRSAALETIGMIGSNNPAVADTCIVILNDIACNKNNPDDVRSSAIAALGDMGANDDALAVTCISVLNKLVSNGALPDAISASVTDAIIGIVNNSQSFANAFSCVSVLANIALNGTIPDDVRSKALSAIVSIGVYNEAILNTLNTIALDSNNSSDLRISAITIVAQSGTSGFVSDQCFNTLQSIASDSDSPEDVRSEALTGIARIGIYNKALTEKCISALANIAQDRSNSDAIRSNALYAIGDLGTRNARATNACASILVKVTLDEKDATPCRLAAFRALVNVRIKIGDATTAFGDIVNRIISGAKSDSDPLGALQQIVVDICTGAKPDDNSIAQLVNLFTDPAIDANALIECSRSLVLLMQYGFDQFFRKLIDAAPQVAAALFKSGFGFNPADEACYIARAIFTPAQLTPEQINLLLTTKDDRGNYILSDEDTVAFFTDWTRQRGGTNPWDGQAMLSFLACPRAKALFPALMDNCSDKMQNQFFLSLMNVVQNGTEPDKGLAIGFLNDNKAFFGIDPSVNLAEPRTQAEWQQIALNSEYSPATRAAALSQIKDGDFLYRYAFNKDRSGDPHLKSTLTDIEFAAIVRTGLTGTWYNTLTSKEERLNYINKILSIDTTDEKKYIYFNGQNDSAINSLNTGSNHINNFLCVDFSFQFLVNCIGLSGSENIAIDVNTEFIQNGYSTPAFTYGIPAYLVTLPDRQHAINAVFIGDDISDEDQLADKNNWMLIEPQAGYDVTDTYFSTNEPVEIILQGEFSNHGGSNTGTITRQITIDGNVLQRKKR